MNVFDRFLTFYECFLGSLKDRLQIKALRNGQKSSLKWSRKKLKNKFIHRSNLSQRGFRFLEIFKDYI
jgi:hypothetical protein